MDSKRPAKPNSQRDVPPGIAYFLPEILDLAQAFYCTRSKHARILYVPLKHADVFAGVRMIYEMEVRFGTEWEVDRK